MSFLKIMNQSFSRIGDHCVLPMPFRDTAVKLPNNRWVAEKRLQGLKKLQKDKKFYLDYKTFTNNLFEKEYARVCSTDAESDSSWYIPHHGVYHPNKPAKIRVVYDCSSEFQGRGLLNKKLLSSPDLTNQIVGVLSRFREHDVAFMADIESMFYQSYGICRTQMLSKILMVERWEL